MNNLLCQVALIIVTIFEDTEKDTAHKQTEVENRNRSITPIQESSHSLSLDWTDITLPHNLILVHKGPKQKGKQKCSSRIGK